MKEKGPEVPEGYTVIAQRRALGYRFIVKREGKTVGISDNNMNTEGQTLQAGTFWAQAHARAAFYEEGNPPPKRAA